MRITTREESNFAAGQTKGRTRRSRLAAGLSCGASVLALAAMAGAGAGAAYAADAPAADSPVSTVKEVVVVGVRQSLKTAQQIKKNADTQMDSLTANDIGAFPDKSVAEAIQRVPGITVSRFASTDDSAHFSAEPSGVLIRGLTQVRTEFNGHDSFSADGYRGLNFADIAPELLAGVDAYKNETADMIEGGIAGTVDLRTRLPFDSKGQTITGTIDGSWGDLSKKGTADFSALYTNRWNTAFGEFGFLADYANSHVITASNGVIDGRIATYCSAGFADGSGKAIVDKNGNIPCTSNPFDGGPGWRYVPSNITYSDTSYDRKRTGDSFAAQWRSPDKTILATLQYNDSNYHNVWHERTVEPIFHDLWAAPSFNPVGDISATENADGTPPFVFAPNGMLQKGTINQAIGYWGSGNPGDPDYNSNHAAVAPGVPFVNACYPWTACTPNQMGGTLDTQGRDFDRLQDTQDISGNIKWAPTSQIKANFDVQYVNAFQKTYDILLSPHTAANVVYSTDGAGIPSVSFQPGTNNNYAPGFLGNLHNYYYGYIQDHLDDSNATELATRADLEYKFRDNTWLNSLKVGARYADRQQNVEYSTYNWSGMYASWGCDAAFFNIDNGPSPYSTSCGGPNNMQFNGYKPGITTLQTFNGFFNGHVLPAGPYAIPNFAMLANYPALIKALSEETLGNNAYGQGWNPLCERSNLVDNSCYTAGELVKVREKTEAAYVMLKFGGPEARLFGLTVHGNVGLRYVRTDDNSTAGVSFPTSSWYNSASAIPCNTPIVDPHQVTQISCWLTPQLLAFSNGGTQNGKYGGTHSNWLPSFSVVFGLDDKQLVRVSGSRALARPDFGQLRSFLQITPPNIDVSDTSPYVIYKPGAPHTAANVTGYNFVFSGNSGNAALAPYTADQFDVSYENYFSSTGSFTVDFFIKHFNGGIGLGKYDRQLTNNGAGQPVVVTAGANTNGDGGTLAGFEVAYQRFFDFLPGLWSGLGFQGNYTHVNQWGIKNSNLTNYPVYDGGTAAGGGGVTYNTAGATAVIDSHRLAGISTDSFNAIGLYEKGPIAFRLAYNWRSQYLINNLDVILGLPTYTRATGTLDSSLRYKLNDNIELSAAATNIIGDNVVVAQQVFGDSAVTPGAKPKLIDSSWIKPDRRFQLGIRFKY